MSSPPEPPSSPRAVIAVCISFAASFSSWNITRASATAAGSAALARSAWPSAAETAAIFWSDSSALTRLSVSLALAMTSGRLATSTSNCDCADGITGNLRPLIGGSGFEPGSRGTRFTYRSPVMPCSAEARDRVLLDRRVVPDVGHDAHAARVPRIDADARDPADVDAEVAHGSAFREAGHAALEVDLVAPFLLADPRCPCTRARSRPPARGPGARRHRLRRSWLPYPSVTARPCNARLRSPWKYCRIQGCSLRTISSSVPLIIVPVDDHADPVADPEDGIEIVRDHHHRQRQAPAAGPAPARRRPRPRSGRGPRSARRGTGSPGRAPAPARAPRAWSCRPRAATDTSAASSSAGRPCASAARARSASSAAGIG